MNLKISFKLEGLPLYFVSHKNGRKTFEVEAFDGRITVGIQYDYERRPLLLTSEVNGGERVEVVLLDHRIELYVDGRLMDEEWPCGSRLFNKGDSFTPEVSVCVSKYSESEEVLPSVISSFENAEGWYPGNGVFVGDCMPYRKGEEYHVLYLKDRHHHCSNR